jgi:hypothetical protein
MVLLLKV